MSRRSIGFRVAIAVSAVALTAHTTLVAGTRRAVGPGSTTVAAVSLKISNEIAPPGALTQLKVFVTEPKPISTARADFGLSAFGDVAGIALGSSTGDALGVAVVHGTRLTISVLSPSTTFGMTPDYPVLTIAGHVSATAAVGATIPVSMDGVLEFLDPSGTLYPVSVTDGSVFVAPNVGIEDVMPGSGGVDAGDVVALIGRDFMPTTNVRVKEALLSNVAYVDPSHLDVTFGGPAHLQGAAFEVVNPDNTKATYFSYQRTARQTPSLNLTLQAAVPVFADVDVTSASVGIQGHTTGLALQNRHATRTFAACELVDGNGARVAWRVVSIDPRKFVLLELSELFGTAYSPSQHVRVRSLAPIQVMGVAVDAAGSATPIRAQ
jgi:hypothetical protein